ncbi:YciI family protein [Neisseria weixii]|uniref:YciI family protein n=1 Tax=Neisseria weixii TaxID=1853276 RepID=UPI0035A1616A
MQYFMLLATDADDVHEARMAARPDHLQRLEALKAEGRLLTAGPNPLPDNPERVSGSLIIAQFESLDVAQEWAEKDPYVDAGVYEEILIKPFKPVFGL